MKDLDLGPIQKAVGPVKLDLGCGNNPLGPDWIGVDAIDYPRVSIVGEALEVLHAIRRESIDAIHASHFLEHVADLDDMLIAMTAALRASGTLTIHVPHWSNPHFWSDPTHVRAFGLYTFGYLAHSELFDRELPDYGNRLPLDLRDARLCFSVAPGYGLRTKAMSTIHRRVNATRRSQEFYEANLATLIPCSELRFTLIKHSAAVHP